MFIPFNALFSVINFEVQAFLTHTKKYITFMTVVLQNFCRGLHPVLHLSIMNPGTREAVKDPPHLSYAKPEKKARFVGHIDRIWRSLFIGTAFDAQL